MADSILMILLDRTTDDETEELIEQYSPLIQYLSRLCRVHDVRGYQEALEALSWENVWRAIIILEPMIVGSRFRALSDRIVNYARNGGTAIFEGRFGRLLRPQDLNAYLQNVWGLSWRHGAVSEEWEYALNPACDLKRAMTDLHQDLPRSYRFSGVQLSNVPIQESVYLPKWPQVSEREQRGPRMVSGGCTLPEHDSERWQKLTPIAFARYGRGWVGWSGEGSQTGYKPWTIEVLGSMCGL